MDILALTAAKDIPILFLGIGCILMAVLGGFTSEFNVMVSVKQFFFILLRSLFVGILVFFIGISIKIPWWLKLSFAGLFGFIGVPSILLLIKRLTSTVLSLFQYLDDITKEAQAKSEGRTPSRRIPRTHDDRNEEDQDER